MQIEDSFQTTDTEGTLLTTLWQGLSTTDNVNVYVLTKNCM